MLNAVRWLLAVVIALGSLPALAGGLPQPPQPAPPSDTLPTFTYDQFLLLPVQVHLLKAERLPDAHTVLKPPEVDRILAKVNGIWSQAGIQFYLVSCVAEEAESQEIVRSLGTNRMEAHLLMLRPRATRTSGMLHVYYVHEMGPNGIFLSADGIFVKDSARLRPVPGGIDEPLPRVTAHEIGHALTLRHRQDTFNLLASGTTGTTLNQAEVSDARAGAAKLGWSKSPKELETHRNTMSEPAHAGACREIDRCLAGILAKSRIKDDAAARLRASGTP
jgi:hypothetical protein